MPRRLSFVLISLCLCAPCLGHEDTFIKIQEDGKLKGLPSDYNPARLQIAFTASGKGQPAISSIDIQFGKHKTHLPVCVTGLIHTKSIKDASITASWYHNPSILPPYLQLKFFDSEGRKGRWSDPGLAFLFNLKSAKLISAKQMKSADGGQSLLEEKVDLASRCSAQELRNFSEAETYAS